MNTLMITISGIVLIVFFACVLVLVAWVYRLMDDLDELQAFVTHTAHQLDLLTRRVEGARALQLRDTLGKTPTTKVAKRPTSVKKTD